MYSHTELRKMSSCSQIPCASLKTLRFYLEMSHLNPKIQRTIFSSTEEVWKWLWLREAKILYFEPNSLAALGPLCSSALGRPGFLFFYVEQPSHLRLGVGEGKDRCTYTLVMLSDGQQAHFYYIIILQHV